MADTNQLQVRLVTPDRILVDQTADAVEVPSETGYFEALYGHAPLLADGRRAKCACTAARAESSDSVWPGALSKCCRSG